MMDAGHEVLHERVAFDMENVGANRHWIIVRRVGDSIPSDYHLASYYLFSFV